MSGRIRVVAAAGLVCLMTAVFWEAAESMGRLGGEGPAVPSMPVYAAAASAPVCLACHGGSAYAGLPTFHGDCTACHSGSDAHLAGPSIMNIGKPEAADCLACHTSSPALMHWEFGPHARGDLSCGDCHVVHGPPVQESRSVADRAMDPVSVSCLGCHQEVQAKLSLPSRHPVREGGLACVSCHDPHGSDGLTQVSRTETCLSCHQTHRGPRAFEHAPVAEDCANCHVPHGSANRSLLELPQPALCLQCHSLADNRHALGAAAGARVSGVALRNCVACHSAIHGSNVDGVLRY
jgi:DmsE family decaheme c-type cytochrome